MYHHHSITMGGYSDGLAGENLLALILAVADASAMTTDRLYRPGMNHADAAQELVDKALSLTQS